MIQITNSSLQTLINFFLRHHHRSFIKLIKYNLKYFHQNFATIQYWKRKLKQFWGVSVTYAVYIYIIIIIIHLSACMYMYIIWLKKYNLKSSTKIFLLIVIQTRTNSISYNKYFVFFFISCLSSTAAFVWCRCRSLIMYCIFIKFSLFSAAAAEKIKIKIIKILNFFHLYDDNVCVRVRIRTKCAQ